MAAITPTAFNPDFIHDRQAMGWRGPLPVRFGTVDTTDTWTSTVPIKRIAFVMGTGATNRAAPMLSADRLTVSFNTNAAHTNSLYLVWI